MSESDFDESEYERQYEILHEMFPNIFFTISLDLDEMDKVVSNSDTVVIKCSHTCGCYRDFPRVTDFILVRNKGSGITNKDMINALSENNFDPSCDHLFLEGFDKINDITYEANFGS